MPTAVDGAGLTTALRSVRRALHWQSRRAAVTAVLSVVLLVGIPLTLIPDHLRDRDLAATGPAVEAVVLSTDVRGLRHSRRTAVVQPVDGPPAYVGRLHGERPSAGDRLSVVVDPEEPTRAVLAGARTDVLLTVLEGILKGLLGGLFVTGWGSFGLASRTVRRDVAAAVGRVAVAGPGSVAMPFEVVRSPFPMPKLSVSSFRERSRVGGAEHHEVDVLLADGRSLSGRWRGGPRLARGVQGVAVGDLRPGGRVALLCDRRVLWPDDSPLKARRPAQR